MQCELDCGNKDFEGCEGTIEFTSRLNNIFDILNSRTDTEGEFKQPLCASNKENIFGFLKDSIEFLKKLTISSGLLIESSKKTGVKGLIIDMVTLMMFYEEYVGNGELSRIPVYMLNQDPLESFFGRLRSFPGLGCNDNPTTIQFCSAYRKNLLKNEISSSALANCKDKLNILYTSSSSSKLVHSQDNEQPINLNISQNESSFLDEIVRSDDFDIVDQVAESCDLNLAVAHVAGCVEQKLKAVQGNRAAFDENEKVVLASIPSCNYRIPCKSTFYLCEIVFRLLETHSKKIDFSYSELIDAINAEVVSGITYPNTEFTDAPSKIALTNAIITNCIRIRATYIAKTITLNQKIDSLKSKIRKQKHFTGT